MKMGSVYKTEVINGNLRITRRLVRHDQGEELLPINDYCKFVGESGIMFGKRFSKLVSQNFEFINFILKFKYINKFKELRDVLIEWRQVLTAGIDSSFGHLRLFAEEPRKHKQTTAEELISMCKRNKFCYLNQPFVNSFEPSDIRKTRINFNSKPGFFTSKIYGHIRRFSYLKSLKVAVYLLEEIFTKPMMYTGLWELGGREKDIKLSEDGEVAGTRIVMMCEEVHTIICGYFVQLFTKYLQRIPNTCLFIGKNFDYENIKFIKSIDEKYDFSADGDWKNFDTSITEEYLLAACAILRRSLPNERKYHRYFFYVASSLIIKFVAVPANRVYRIMKGIPSGHGFTSLVGSLVNYLYLLKIGEEIYGKGNVTDNMFFLISGDDLKVWFKYHDNLLNINSIIDEHLPGECGDLLCNLMPCKHNYNVDIKTKFLKRKVDRYYNVYWDRKSFFNKIIYSKRRMKYFSEIKSWMKMWIETAPFDYEVNNMMKHFVKHNLKYGTNLYDTNKEFLYDLIDEEFNAVTRRGMLKVLCPHVAEIGITYDLTRDEHVVQRENVYAVSDNMSEVDLLCHALINFGSGPITYYRKLFLKRIKDWSKYHAFSNKSVPAYKYLVNKYYYDRVRRYVQGLHGPP